MKKMIAVAALLAVTSASAQDLKFGDLNYFLKQGQFNLTADATVFSETTRVDKSIDVDNDGYLFDGQFAYAVSDKLNVFAGLSYIMEGETDEEGDSYLTSGLQNPRLGANFRVMNQNEGGFNLDLGAVAHVKLMDREVGSNAPSENGDMFDPTTSSYADPRNSLEINARLGKKWNEANEFYVLAGANYHMSGEYEQANQDVDVDSSFDLKAGAFYQYRPVHEFMLTVGLSGIRYSDVDGESAAGDFTLTNHVDLQVLFNAKYLINDNLIVKFAMVQDRRGEANLETEGSSDQDLDKRQAFKYGLGVDWLF